MLGSLNMKNARLNSSETAVDFKAKQEEFAAYIRDPENNPAPPDVKEDRMKMYRQLFFNNVDGFLAGNFPVLRKLLDDSSWRSLVQDFFSTHQCETPHFSEIPEEFLSFLEHERDKSNDFPFILELAHYEWVEMALATTKDKSPKPAIDLDNLLNAKINLSNLAWPLAYQYPVNKISPDFIPLTPPEQATFLIVYRNHEDEVNFLEITPLTYRLLEVIQTEGNGLTQTCLAQIATESRHPNPDIIINSGLQILKDLCQKEIIGLAEE